MTYLRKTADAPGSGTKVSPAQVKYLPGIDGFYPSEYELHADLVA
jgi:hypothetical protein